MKFLTYILFFVLIFTSCKSVEKTNDTSNTATALSVKKIAKKHTDAHFDKNTVDAKLKVAFKNDKENVDFSVRMKIKKDEVIWLKGTKIISLFKAKITPEKVSFYSPYKKNYIEGDFETLKKFLGFEVDFYQLQNLLLGQALYDVNKEKHNASIVNNAFQLSPKEQPDLFEIFYNINAKHFKLDEQYLINTNKQQRLDVKYPKYITKENVLFPESIQIIAKSKNKYSNIDILVRSVIFDEELNIPYQIPQGYKEIKL